jgi:tripartite-type tricarboxylate transporter receptor subunit TctC
VNQQMKSLRFALLAAVVAVPFAAAAQDRFPSRPISLVVPFPPGGVADQTARPVSSAMERLLKQPMPIRNVPAAAGAVGMSNVANARPDGYTLLMTLSSISIIPEADKLFGRAPAYTIDQLAPVALFAADPTVLVVKADSPWKTVEDLVKDAKARPNTLSFSSSGIYGTLHMAMAMFTTAADITMRHVPFNGGGPALTALLGGNVDALASGPGPVLPQIKAGTLRVLASWGDKRLAALPDAPTFKELGYKDVEFYIWCGLFAPAKTPEAVLKTLRDASKTIAQDPEFVQAMTNLQTPVTYMDAPEFKAFWDKDAARLAEAVKRVGKIEQ